MYKKTHGMPEDAFYHVVDNMRLFVKIRNEIGSDTSFGVGFLTSQDTKQDMEHFVILAKESGVDFAQFCPFTGDFCNILDEYMRLKKI